MMPETVNAIARWLPTSMAIELIGPLFLVGQLSPDAPLNVLGLLAYTALFAAISAVRLGREG